MPYYLRLHICNWCLSSSVPHPILVEASRLLSSLWRSPGWRFEPEFSGECTLWKRGVVREERETRREAGLSQPEVEKEEKYFDWQLSGSVPAEVVPPVDCYYLQKDFPLSLAGTMSPLSTGGWYPIWEMMNRGPYTLYEVYVDRIFTEAAQWSKQAFCQQQHLQHRCSKHIATKELLTLQSWVSEWSIWGICLCCRRQRRAPLDDCRWVLKKVEFVIFRWEQYVGTLYWMIITNTSNLILFVTLLSLRLRPYGFAAWDLQFGHKGGHYL